MITELKRIEDSVLKNYGQKFSDLTKDLECDEYLGYNFKIDRLNIKFRKAKITPKKVGQFVTLWKRNAENITTPFHITDPFDFYIIVAEEQEQFGFFFFPKQVLVDKQMLSDANKEGKRGFRVYPSWAITNNKQAEKTQNWQIKYFINLNDPESLDKYNALKSK